MKTLGIVGGGQLGMFIAEAAKRLGFIVVILDSSRDVSAAKYADEFIEGSFLNEADVLKLGEKADIVTFETERANPHALSKLEARGKIVHPSPGVLNKIQDKYEQKVFVKSLGLKTADFLDMPDVAHLVRAKELLGYPYLLKGKKDSYDGKGNALVASDAEAEEAFTRLSPSGVYAEKFVPFDRELAVMVARSATEIKAYPVVETVHKNHICDIVYAPAPIENDTEERARDIGMKVVEALSGIGVFGVEMFQVGGDIYINEIAPRVHNSGHYTLDGSETSQFEQHVRAITGMPLGDVVLKSSASVMVNILGERDGVSENQVPDDVPSDVFIHLYGKKETRIGRKMGHVTALSNTREEAETKARQAASRVRI